MITLIRRIYALAVYKNQPYKNRVDTFFRIFVYQPILKPKSAIRNIQNERQNIGCSSSLDRVRNLQQNVNVIDANSHDQYAIDLSNAMTGVVQSASEVSQSDGNLIKPSSDVLDAAERTLAILATNKNQYDASQVNQALGKLAFHLEKVRPKKG